MIELSSTMFPLVKKPVHMVSSQVSRLAHLTTCLTKPEPASWRQEVQACLAYKLSCLTFSFAGAISLMSLDTLRTFVGWFPWQPFGFLCLIQGLLSYMADVYTFGRASPWKTADALCAIILTLVCASFPILQIAGVMNFPSQVSTFFGAVILLALGCKFQSSNALEMGRDPRLDPTSIESHKHCIHYVFYHTAWHLVLTSGSVICIVWLHYIQSNKTVGGFH